MASQMQFLLTGLNLCKKRFQDTTVLAVPSIDKDCKERGFWFDVFVELFLEENAFLGVKYSTSPMCCILIMFCFFILRRAIIFLACPAPGF